MVEKKSPQEAAGHNSVPSNKPDYCGSRSFNWFEVTLIDFNLLSIDFNLLSIYFELISNYFEFTFNWFQFTANLLSIDIP